MPRDVEKEQEQIWNGNRFIVSTEETTGVFIRDVDKLFHQYRNLRMSIYNQYKGYLSSDPITQDELRSYIDEQFIRLVKEYDIGSDVDFPGYIKIKLHSRVKNSFIKSVFRDKQRVFVTRNSFDVSNLIEQNPCNDEELDYYVTLEYAIGGFKLSQMEKEVLFYLLQELTDPQIERAIKDDHPRERISSATIRETIKDMSELLRTKLLESLEN
ncbi:RNA polymerase sigma factor [Bacillus phage JBP901]|uniref:Putative RNA polymerase sigma factor n=1 Tax=Bacillus phage JBP901 TaxID=1498212 RepID=A0A0E3DF47_9CAUD|nr:RNA polymerase sigma factor [Bacillus phage JBP901]AID17841.1 putative RNA polymerase sigma factor [Bacillus phage JBP901]ANY29362.1 putative RNA polymerase sigma factor [Bacillus phage PK16]AUM58916.1 DNA replication/modification protein [Bacillus phage BCP01]WQZ49441.1 putative RNA polymerase sigma factor [Bacillus phage Z3]